MRKTIYLHIGHYKTGTTALQVFLSNNQKRLVRRGVDYAEELRNHAKHSSLAFSIYRKAGVSTLMHGYADPTPPEKIWRRLFDHASASPAPAVLVSSEEFMRMGAHPRAAEILRDIVTPEMRRFDIRVIAYLRSPGAHLRSWYNQLIKMSAAPPDFNAAVRSVMEPVHYDYGQALRPWVDIFGPEAVMVRPYREDLRLDNGLFRDFLAALGVDFDCRPKLGGWVLPEGDVNPRLDDRLLELNRAMQEAGLTPELRKWMGTRAEKALPDLAAAPGFAAIVERTQSGLDALRDLPGNQVAPEAFAADMPSPDPDWQGELTRMMATALREQQILRERLQARNRELTSRLDQTEARLDALERRLEGRK